MRAGNFLRGLVAAILLMQVCIAAHAEYKYDYSHGLQALEDGDYAKARKLIQQAIDDHPEPAVRVRLYGQVWQPYVPQYYLGLTAFRQGDCAQAVTQWNLPANRDVVAQVPKIAAAQTRDLDICNRKIAAEGSPQQTPKLAEAVKAPSENPKAAKQPEPARTQTGRNTQIGANVAVDGKTVVPVKAATSRNQPPQPLVDAFADYLAGRYDKVARINPDSYAQSQPRFHAWLVRAASKFTLARISGDAGMLDSARSDVRSARALDADTKPDAEFFSPTFRAFYRASK